MDYLELDRIIRTIKNKESEVNEFKKDISLSEYKDFLDENNNSLYKYVEIKHNLGAKDLVVVMTEDTTNEELNVPIEYKDENSFIIKTLFPKQGTLIVRK